MYSLKKTALWSMYRTASFTPKFSWYSDCSRSRACCACVLISRGISISRVFRTTDIRATGWWSSTPTGLPTLGIGERHETFHRTGTWPVMRLQLNKVCRVSASSETLWGCVTLSHRNLQTFQDTTSLVQCLSNPWRRGTSMGYHVQRWDGPWVRQSRRSQQLSGTWQDAAATELVLPLYKA